MGENKKSESKVAEKPKNENVTKDPLKKKKIITIAVIVVIIAAIVIGVIVWATVFKKKTVDLSKYIEVEYSGYDGYAVATVTISDDLKDYLDSKKTYENFVEKIEFEIEDNEDLSNGDTITIEASISESFMNKNKLKLKSETISVVVEGLEEADVLDVFADDEFEIEITGVSPSLSITVNNNSSNSFIKNYVTYSLSSYSGLANGDVVTITAYYDSIEADEEGIIIAEDTMEYTIEGEPEYIENVDDVTDNILDELSEIVLETLNDEIEDDDGDVIYYNYDDIDSEAEFESSEPELVKTYLLTKKGSSWYSSTNKICQIYKVVYTNTETSASYEWYYVTKATDVAAQDDEIYEKDDIYVSVSGRWDEGLTEDDAYDDLIDSEKSSYVIEEVN